MSKSQLIDAIREQNRTATAEFLAVFDEDALSNYLNHLNYRHGPRGSQAVWVRPKDTAAIVTRAVKPARPARVAAA